MVECECLNCGNKVSITGHCMDTACPECGGRMRRVDRPGVGNGPVTNQKLGIMARIKNS